MIALLCKTSVARNILQFAFDTNLPITQASIYMVDAKKWFNAGIIGPVKGKPVLLDDTCYFIPCYSLQDAVFLASLLNDPLCLEMINAVAFLRCEASYYEEAPPAY